MKSGAASRASVTDLGANVSRFREATCLVGLSRSLARYDIYQLDQDCGTDGGALAYRGRRGEASTLDCNVHSGCSQLGLPPM